MKCNCEKNGWCETMLIYCDDRVRHLCSTSPAHHAMFERLASGKRAAGNTQPQKVAIEKDPLIVSRMNDPCIHRSDNPTERGSCGSCPKTWRYKCYHPSIDKLVTIQDCGACPLYE